MGAQPAFELFGDAHLAALVIAAACAAGVVWIPGVSMRDRVPRILASSLIVLVIGKPLLYVGVYGEPWTTSLPLALCRINEFLCIYLLLTRSFRTFEIAYFLTIGSVAALLTPDLPVGFPDPRFILFFLSHSLALVAIVYAITGFGFRPTLRSVRNVLIFLALYTLVIAGVNVLLDANYLFLRQKPEGASVLDFFGPWPFYVAVLIALAIALCFLCYLPFALFGTKARKQPRNVEIGLSNRG